MSSDSSIFDIIVPLLYFGIVAVVSIFNKKLKEAKKEDNSAKKADKKVQRQQSEQIKKKEKTKKDIMSEDNKDLSSDEYLINSTIFDAKKENKPISKLSPKKRKKTSNSIEIKDILKSKNELKKAFILSEILNKPKALRNEEWF